MDYEVMANEELAVRAQEGDTDAENVLYENVYRLICKLSQRIIAFIVIHADKYRSFGCGFFNNFSRTAKSIVRGVYFCYQSVLGQLSRAQRSIY